jgi:hypothetical protein
MSKIDKGEPGYNSRNRNKLPALAAGAVLVATVFAGMTGRGSSEEIPVKEPSTEQPTPTTVVVAEKGDSAWSIAKGELAASGIPRDDMDIRPIVNDIVERNGVNIQIGQHVTLADIPNVGPPILPKP